MRKLDLMEKLFYENDLLFHPNIIIDYEIWVKNERPSGNRSQKMRKYINIHLELYRSRNEIIYE